MHPDQRLVPLCLAGAQASPPSGATIILRPPRPKFVKRLWPTGLDHERFDRPFAKRFARLQPMKTLDQDEARLIPTYQNRHCQAVLQYVVRELSNSL